MNFVQYFEPNEKGRDFVVGDVHGYFDQLYVLLNHVKFDKQVDRLFSCGDLVDRGPHSMECAQLICEPWFHCVTGNHEQMMAHALKFNDAMNYNNWIYNGGHWYESLGQQDRKECSFLSDEMNNLPLVIVVGKDTKDRFNIVHGELTRYRWVAPSGFVAEDITDNCIDDWTFNEDDIQDMTWGRKNLLKYKSSTLYGNTNLVHPTFQTEQLSLTYCGHNVMKHKPVVIGRQMYIDQGSGFGLINTNLTIAEPKQKRTFIYNFQDESVYSLPYRMIQNYTEKFGEYDD